MNVQGCITGWNTQAEKLFGWSRAEARAAERIDRRAAEEIAEIRIREARLAERLGREQAVTDRAPDAQPGSGVSR